MLGERVLTLFICFTILLNLVSAAELPYKEGELLVRFAPKQDKAQRTLAEKNDLLATFEAGTVKKTFKKVKGLTVVKLPVDLTVEEALEKFKDKEGFLYAEPNYRLKQMSTFPNDTRFNELWGMHNTGQTGGTEDADIDAPEAWDIITDSDVIVAVIDTGIDYNHPDLAANMWINY